MVGWKASLLAVAYMTVLWHVKLHPWFEAVFGIDWIPAEVLDFVLLPVHLAAFFAVLLWWLAAGIIAMVLLSGATKLLGMLRNG